MTLDDESDNSIFAIRLNYREIYLLIHIYILF